MSWLRRTLRIESPSSHAMALGRAVHEAFERAVRWPYVCSPNDGSVWFEREEPVPHRVLLWGPCSPRLTTRHGTRRRRATRAGEVRCKRPHVCPIHPTQGRCKLRENLFRCWGVKPRDVWFGVQLYCSRGLLDGMVGCTRESIHERHQGRSGAVAP